MTTKKKFYTDIKKFLDNNDNYKLMKSIYDNINYIKDNKKHNNFKNAVIIKCKKYIYTDIDNHIKNNTVTNKEIQHLEELRECCFNILYQLDEIK
jgi:hypothetical protein